MRLLNNKEGVVSDGFLLVEGEEYEFHEVNEEHKANNHRHWRDGDTIICKGGTNMYNPRVGNTVGTNPLRIRFKTEEPEPITEEDIKQFELVTAKNNLILQFRQRLGGRLPSIMLFDLEAIL